MGKNIHPWCVYLNDQACLKTLKVQTHEAQASQGETGNPFNEYIEEVAGGGGKYRCKQCGHIFSMKSIGVYISKLNRFLTGSYRNCFFSKFCYVCCRRWAIFIIMTMPDHEILNLSISTADGIMNIQYTIHPCPFQERLPQSCGEHSFPRNI